MSVQMKTRAHSQDEAARTQLEKDPLSMVHGFGPSLQEMHTPVTCCVHAWKRTPVSIKHNASPAACVESQGFTNWRAP